MARERPRTKRDLGISLGATLLALLASQHHLLHMLLLSVGIGGAGTGLLALFPAVRRAMLLLSVALLGATLFRTVRRPPPLSGLVLMVGSLVATVGLVAWSVARFGW